MFHGPRRIVCPGYYVDSRVCHDLVEYTTREICVDFIVMMVAFSDLHELKFPLFLYVSDPLSHLPRMSIHISHIQIITLYITRQRVEEQEVLCSQEAGGIQALLELVHSVRMFMDIQL